MKRSSSPLRPVAFPLCLLLLATVAPARSGSTQPQAPAGQAPAGQGSAAGGAQDPAGARAGGRTQVGPASLPQGTTRESMWWAPTAEDWAKPCLITWQRSFEDALEVSKQTGKPILVCVNMDGEIASEHYAGVRYRQPETAALYEPYVCVIASVYRHTPRDHDEEGNRILCPRFGSVTCGEHIAIEPKLFDQFFEGERVAPRHIMVELDRSEVYDVYYAWDTDSVFKAIRTGIEEREIQPRPQAQGDRGIEERVASRDIADRIAVEVAYRQGDPATRRKLVEAALAHPEAAPVEVLRLAIYDLDVDLNVLARRALARVDSEASIDLIVDALRAPMDASERQALIDSLRRIGESSPRARQMVVVYEGLASRSGSLDQAGWSQALEGLQGGEAASSWRALGARIEYQSEAARSRPEDAAARLELAESYLALAVEPETSMVRDLGNGNARDSVPGYAQLLLEDARRAALQAEELGASGWRVDAAVGLASYYLKDVPEAYRRAEAAMADLPAGEQGWNAMAVLALFAEARRDAISKAVRAKQDWPKEWLTDVHAAYSVLARHPLGTDALVAAHYDFLKALDAQGQADKALDEGLRRYPASWLLHDRMRARILREKGVEGLRAVYDGWIAEQGSTPDLEWFAGYAALVGAEFDRRGGREPRALEGYGDAIGHYERVIEGRPESREAADHYIAIALAGRARLALERGDLEQALAELEASFARRREAAATLDGLGLSAVGTTQALVVRARDAGREDVALAAQAALDQLRAFDPRLLELPAFERGGPSGPSPDARRFGGGRRPRQGR